MRNRLDSPKLAVRQILAWVDDYRAATGRWPTAKSGPIAGAQDETWLAIDKALRAGRRGLAGGKSLARLLDESRR